MQSTLQEITRVDQHALRVAVERLLRESPESLGSERPAQGRYPFFRPVTVAVDGDEADSLLAFTRDISPLGIGLLHNAPLERGEVVLRFTGESNDQVLLRSEIVWCHDCGEGWYLSGARFLEVAADA